MILVGLLVVAFGVAYLVWPWFREKTDGLRTMFFGVMAGLGPLLDAIDPGLLSQALALDSRWKAGIMVALGVAVVWSRMLVSKPGPLAKK